MAWLFGSLLHIRLEETYTGYLLYWDAAVMVVAHCCSRSEVVPLKQKAWEEVAGVYLQN